MDNMREVASAEGGPKTPEAILTKGLESLPEQFERTRITVSLPPELATVPEEERAGILEKLRKGLQTIGTLTAFVVGVGAMTAEAGWAREAGHRVNEFSPVPTPEQVLAKEQSGMKMREHSFNKGASEIIIEGPKANLPDIMPKVLKLLPPKAGEEPESPFLVAGDEIVGDLRKVTYTTKEKKPTEIGGTVLIPYVQTEKASGSVRLTSDDELVPLGRPATVAGGEAPWGEGTPLLGYLSAEQRVQIPVTEDKKIAVTVGIDMHQEGKQEGATTPSIGISVMPDEFTEFAGGIRPSINAKRAEVDILGTQKPLGLEGSATHRTDSAKGWFEYGAQVQAQMASDKITTDPSSLLAGARGRVTADKALMSWGPATFFAGGAAQAQYAPATEGRRILQQVGGRIGVLVQTPPEWKESKNPLEKFLGGYYVKVSATLYGALPKDPTGPAFALEIETREQPPEKKKEEKK